MGPEISEAVYSYQKSSKSGQNNKMLCFAGVGGAIHITKPLGTNIKYMVFLKCQ